MGRLALVAFVLLVGCSQASGSTAVASAQPSPSATPLTPPTTSPPPVVDLPLSAADFSCRLPVTRSTGGGDFVSYQGGFLTFPQASFTPDAAGVINSEYPAQDFVTTAKPVLHGTQHTGPPFFDLALKRWVPVGAGQASPDGASYAYAAVNRSNPGANYLIHVVDVASGADRTYSVPTAPDFGDGSGAYIADFDGASVYFSSAQSTGPLLGVWRLDVATGAVTELTRVSGVAAVRGGYAWVNRIDSRDPQGPQFPGIGGHHSNSVVRVDLATGQQTVWYYAKGNEVFFAGFDSSGNPLISNSWPPFAYGFLLVAFTPNGDVATVYDGSRTLSFSGVQGDDGGRLWLSNDRGIYVYAPGRGLRKVFAFNGNPTAAEAIQPAGFCT